MSETPMEPEGYPLEPDAGMVPDPETVDETVTGDVDPAGEIGTEGLGEDADGNAVTQAEGRPAPVDAWSEADPDFEDLLSLEAAEAQQDDPEADLPVEAPEEELEDEDLTVPDDGTARWVQYELWGRNVSLGEGWTLYAVTDFAGDIEAEVDDLTAGTSVQLRVRLVDNLGRFSKWSAAIQVSLPSDFTPPPEPTAPQVSDNNGIIVTRWDGQLMGETPADMSHVLHYVQQMHPAGDPDGPAGDPQLISEFRRQGRHTSGNFPDRVQHRAWLSAVDTTGNESPRSEYAYFTPSAPVDAQRINEELETLVGRVGEGFEESLTEAIAGADQRIDSLAVGELFVENAIKAPSIDVQDLAANVARMNELWTGFAGIAEAQIDDLLANTGKFKEINAPVMQSHVEEALGWKLRPGTGLEMWGPDQKKTIQIDGAENFIQGSLATAEGVAGRVHLRRYAASEIYSGTPSQQVLAGMGFESDSIPRVAGAFVQENDGRVVLSSGTGGDSTQGRPYGYMAGGWEAQWLRPRDRLETFDSCIVGRPVSPALVNNFRVAPSGEQEPSYTRLGDWVMLSGAVRKPLPEPSNWSGTIMFVPAPGFTRRISTTIASEAGLNEPIPLIILIDTSGRLSVLNGVGLSRNWSLSLDGLIYKL